MKKKIISLLVLPILFSCSNNDMANVQSDLLIDGTEINKVPIGNLELDNAKKVLSGLILVEQHLVFSEVAGGAH